MVNTDGTVQANPGLPFWGGRGGGGVVVELLLIAKGRWIKGYSMHILEFQLITLLNCG